MKGLLMRSDCLQTEKNAILSLQPLLFKYIVCFYQTRNHKGCLAAPPVNMIRCDYNKCFTDKECPLSSAHSVRALSHLL